MSIVEINKTVEITPTDTTPSKSRIGLAIVQGHQYWELRVKFNSEMLVTVDLIPDYKSLKKSWAAVSWDIFYESETCAPQNKEDLKFIEDMTSIIHRLCIDKLRAENIFPFNKG